MNTQPAAVLRRALRGLPPLLLLLLIGLVLWFARSGQDDALRVACADLTVGCAHGSGADVVVFGSDVRPNPMQPFKLWLRAPGARTVEASFTMEGMDMGFNLYRLRVDDQGVFRADITLPVCVTGRRDWIMNLRIDDTRLAVPFVTDM